MRPRNKGYLAVALTSVALSIGVAAFIWGGSDSEPLTERDTATAPSWCPEVSDVQDAIGPAYGTWEYEGNGFDHPCRFAAFEGDDLQGQFVILRHDDDWWAGVSVPPHGIFQHDRTEWISQDVMIAYPGAVKADQGMCDLLEPGQQWIIALEGGGACEIILEVHSALG